MVALVMAAFMLRMIDLERRPLHFDEGINVTLGYRSPADVLSLSRETFDNDPPGHRLALGVWMRLAGPSPLAIRIFSVFFSLLAVALVYRMCREMRLGFWPSLAAAGFLAFAPYSIDYAQQAKGYAVGIGMSMLSWWMWLRLFTPGASKAHRPVTLTIYVLSTALALSTHYYTFFLLPMQWLWYLGSRISGVSSRTKHDRSAGLEASAGHDDRLKPRFQNGRSLGFETSAGQDNRLKPQVQHGDSLGLDAPAGREGPDKPSIPERPPEILQTLAAQIMACIPMGVWLALMATSLQVSTARSSSTMQYTSVLALLQRIMGEISSGQFAAPGLSLLGAVALSTTLVAGAYSLWRWKGDAERGAMRTAFWFGLAFLVPLAGALIMQLRVSFFFPRFLLYALPNASVLIAGCLLPLRSKAGVASRLPAFALSAVLIAGLAAFYGAPIDSANDYRPIVTKLRPLIKPGDSALGAYIWMQGIFISYAPETAGALRWYTESYSADTVDALLQPITQSSPRVWSVNFRRDPDAPTTLSVAWLKQHAAYADRFSSGATSVLLFDTRTAASAKSEMQRSAIFSGPAVLSGPAVPGGNIRLDYTFTSQTAQPGDTVLVQLQWSALSALDDYSIIYLHLIAPDGALAAQNDGDAVNGLAPDFTWAVGKPVIDRRAVLIPAELAPGDYTLVAGMYRKTDGVRLRTAGGQDGVPVGIVHLTW